MEYQIVERGSVKELKEAVQRMLDLGWKVQGGMCIAYDTNLFGNSYFYQAMLRKEK